MILRLACLEKRKKNTMKSVIRFLKITRIHCTLPLYQKHASTIWYFWQFSLNTCYSVCPTIAKCFAHLTLASSVPMDNNMINSEEAVATTIHVYQKEDPLRKLQSP